MSRQRLHRWALAFWAANLPLAFSLGWLESVTYVSLASIYANVSTHWSALEGARPNEEEHRMNKFEAAAMFAFGVVVWAIFIVVITGLV